MITDTTVKKSYACNGSQTQFVIPFPFDQVANIVVKLRHKTTGEETCWSRPTHYSVSGTTVVAVSAPSDDYVLWIFRTTPLTQTSDFEDLNKFPVQATENAHDKLTRIVQELSEKLTRALLFKRTTAEVDHELPEPENEYFLRWLDGKLVNAKAFAGSTYSIQSFMKTFLEALDAAAARTAIGAASDSGIVKTTGNQSMEGDLNITAEDKKVYVQDGKVQVKPSSHATAPHDTHSTTQEVLRLIGSTSDLIHSIQDGTGRYQIYWNATPGTSPVFLVASEDAFKLLISTGGTFKLYWADGSAASAGDAISWNELFKIDQNGWKFMGAGSNIKSVTVSSGAPSGGNDDDLWLQYDTSGTHFPAIAIFEDQKTSGTHGGDPSSTSAWFTRTLNTVAVNQITGASLSSNQITLPAGTYEIRAEVPGMRINQWTSRLYNVTDTAVALPGTGEHGHTSYGPSHRSIIHGVVTLAAQKTLRIEQRCTSNPGGGWGLGYASVSVSSHETYTRVWIRKID